MDFSKIIVQTVISLPFEENVYLVHLDNPVLVNGQCFLVDPGFEPEKVIERVRSDNLDVAAVLVTHGHADHIAGIGAIKKEWPECVIYVGEEDKIKLIDATQNLSASFGVPITVAPADIALHDGEKIEVAGIPIEVFHAPGHSRGHLLFYIPTEPKGILFAGDVLFQDSIGRSDFPDGDEKVLLDSIRTKILTLPDETIVYSGHGPSTTVGRERRFNPFLKR